MISFRDLVYRTILRTYAALSSQHWVVNIQTLLRNPVSLSPILYQVLYILVVSVLHSTKFHIENVTVMFGTGMWSGNSV